MFDYSHFYYRFLDELGDRLDVLRNDKIFEIIEEQISATRFPFVPLYEVADFLDENRNPQGEPHEEFLYVDIGSIDITRGEPLPVTLLGHQATSARMRRVIRSGNVLVSTTRPTRKAVCIVPSELNEQICSTGFVVLNCKPGIINKFLFYVLRSDMTTLQLERLCSGSGYPAINKETDLPKVQVPKPEERIQQDIISAIEPIETMARLLDEPAKKNRQMADDLLLAELGVDVSSESSNYFFKTGAEKRTIWFDVFPEHMTDRLQYLFFHPRYDALYSIMSKYHTVSLANICREPIIRGEQPEYDEFGEITVLKTADLKNAYIDYDKTLKVSREFYEANPHAHVRKDDILVASTGYVSMGKVDVYDSNEPAMVDGHISIVRAEDSYDPHFVAYFLRSHLGQLQFEKWFSGSSGQIELQPTDLNQFIIFGSDEGGVPLPKQRRIANVISAQMSKALELEQQAEMKWREVQKRFQDMIIC